MISVIDFGKEVDKWEELDLEQSTHDPSTDKLSISISDLRISGNPKNQTHIPEKTLFNQVYQMGVENLKAKKTELESWKSKNVYQKPITMVNSKYQFAMS